MKSTAIPKRTTTKATVITGRQRNYNEVVEFLDAHWTKQRSDLSVMQQLDNGLGTLSQKVNTIIIDGTNGKSLTAHFTGKLLSEENLSVGIFSSPHILTYNERFIINNESISNKIFTDIANEVINYAESVNLTPNSFEILTMMALIYFHNNNVDVALLETDKQGKNSPVHICTPKIIAITRIADPELLENSDEIGLIIEQAVAAVKPNVHVVSADQSKLNLQAMQLRVEEKGGIWMMPIRKLAPLAYPFEQLHGRCAALAERIAHSYINGFSAASNNEALNASLLSKQKGQRGRPTLEAKRLLELNPKKTLDQFWREAGSSLPGRFQLLDKEKPTILLDNASNLDALKNILLGARLLHYQRSLKGLSIILGFNDESINRSELLKTLRYFFKKTSGQVILCPVKPLPGQNQSVSWDIEKMTNEIKSMKIKARSAKNLKEALEAARDTVDERNGLVIVTGSTNIISQFWEEKGIKKF